MTSKASGGFSKAVDKLIKKIASPWEQSSTTKSNKFFREVVEDLGRDPQRKYLLKQKKSCLRIFKEPRGILLRTLIQHKSFISLEKRVRGRTSLGGTGKDF